MNALIIKIIAITTMLIDHAGHVLFPNEIIFREIGRVAFPLFAFLIANGAIYTKNINKYLARLGILAIISEPLFDLMSGKQINFFTDTNIFYTLFLAVLSIAIWKKSKLLGCTAFLIFISLATYIRVDYGGLGVAFIICLYLVKNNKMFSSVIIAFFMWRLYGVSNFFFVSLVSIIPILLYNNEQGFNNKITQWGFYFFYPLHILILILLRYSHFT